MEHDAAIAAIDAAKQVSLNEATAARQVAGNLKVLLGGDAAKA